MQMFAEEFETDLNASVLRRTFGLFPSGVTTLCARVDTVPVGMAASSFTSVSLDPPLVSVCIQNNSSTWPVLSTAPALGLSILGRDQDDVCRSLAAKGIDRFEGVDWVSSSSGAVFIRQSVMDLECRIESSFDAGDHKIVVLRLLALRSRPDMEPMVFHRSKFRRLEVFTD